MEFEIRILDFIQGMRTPLGDWFMPLVSSLGNTGIIWIVLALVLLAVPKTRKAGAVLAAALSWDVVLCDGILKHLFARVRPCDINTSIQLLISRPYGGFLCFRYGALFFGEAKALESGSFARLRDSVFQIVFICAFSDGYPRRHSGRAHRRICRI